MTRNFFFKNMKRIEDFTVIQHHWLNENTFLIELKSSGQLPVILPGNFAQIQINNTPGVFLRRPFSIYNADYKNNTLTFFIKIVGKGSRELGLLKPGDITSIIYPLGNTFSLPDKDKVLIVGGGSGIAPFLLLGKSFSEHQKKTTFLIGGQSKQDIMLTGTFKKYGDVLITTEDGSLGEKGLVTDHSVFNNNNFGYDMIYTCGPDPMMKAVANIARNKNIPCEASLENIMACGFGACLCCVVETTSGNKCVCTEGPVFNINDLAW